jgi:flagellar capping protein FliD
VTQTQPDRIDRIESFIERMDHKLDAIAGDIQEMKLDSQVFQARTEERFNTIDERFKSVETQLSEIKGQLKSQDTRIWSLAVGVVLALFGLLAKVAFFPDVKV